MKFKFTLINLKKSFIVMAISGLLACSSSTCSSDGNSPQPFAVNNPLTIDSAGVVPVIGDNTTTSIIYVHNNTQQTIKEIKYSAKLNTGEGNFLDSNSTGACATIPAGQSCPLTFTTPTISKTTAQGSALITANYSYNNQALQFNQTLSFSRIDDNIAKGALFSSGVSLSGSGNDMAYGTVYIYGSGLNKVYTVDSITSNKSGVQIIQGNISGKQLQSNYVSALEVSAPTNLLNNAASTTAKTNLAINNDGGYNATLTAISSSDGNNYTSTSNVGVMPSTSGAILTSGNVPIIDTSVANPTGTLYITNAGNQAANIGVISFPAGVTRTGGDCSSTLESTAGCSIVFSVPQSSGNGNITVNYTGGSASSLVSTIVWYNGKNEALLQMTANPNPLTFNASVGANTTVILNNIGGYNLTGITTNQTTTTGNATSTATTPVCVDSSGTATGTNLLIGGSCSYTVTISDAIAENGSINFNVSGSYNNGTSQTYSRVLAVGYTSNQYRALLSVPAVTMPTIAGNNSESSTSTFKVTNNGEAPAIISGSVLSNNPDYLIMSNNGCASQTINSGESCSITLKLGPTVAQSQLSGTALYTVTYSGGQTTAGTTATSNINYTVQPDNQSLTMDPITITSGITGTGTNNDPYQIAGNLNSPSITLTYRNTGTNPVRVTGINNTNSPIAWALDATTCSDPVYVVNISPNQTCVIVFKNVLSQYGEAVSGGLTATYTENLIVPTLVLQDIYADMTQFEITPPAPAPINGTTIYVQGNQATLANSVTQASGTTVTVSHSLANATGYPSLTVVSQMEDYFSGTPSATNCTTNPESGVMTQTCTLSQSAGIATASVIYTKNSAYFGSDLHVLFDLTTTGVVVSFTPLSALITLN